MEVARARNLLVHEDEIKARAPRIWIQSKKEKQAAQALSAEAHKVGCAKLVVVRLFS